MKKIQFNKFHLRRGWWKSLLAAILCIGVIVGAGFGIASIFKPDKVDDFVTYTTLPVTKFRVGGLDGNGNYMNTDQSIYTKDAFECQGLNCTLDFDNEISYQVYFYDQNNEFVHTTGRLTGAFVQDSVPFFAKYARIVITPNDDNKVSMLEVMKYAKQLKVTIYREQGFKNYTENLFIEDMHGYVISGTDGNLLSTPDELTHVVCKYINISSYKEAMLFRTIYTDISNSTVYLYDSQKNYVGYILIGESSSLIFESSEGVKYFSIDFKSATIHTNENCVDHEPAFVRLSTHDVAEIGVYCR